MAYEALYRRYRPGRFADVTGQHHVMQALRNAVANDRVGHAYMFSGPRGTGKTTSARILAKALNCTNRAPGEGEPCDACPSCLSFQAGTSYDLRELDAASNNGVEAMRDLISKVGLSAGGHGVFILDEAHMLSTGAENALLKTLEEPPPNVTFILCTTEPNKVVPTIRSRTQHFDFSLLSGDELDGLVREVLNADGIELADDDIDYVVRAGNGSARDTLSALDQVIAAGGAPETGDHGGALMQALSENDTGAVLVATHEALRSGRDPELVGRDLLTDLRNAFLATMRADLSHLSESDRASALRWGEVFSPAAVTRAVELLGMALVSMRQAPDPRVDLEVALVRLTRPDLDTDPSALLARIERLESGGPGASQPPLEATGSTGPGQAGPVQDAPAETSSTPPKAAQESPSAVQESPTAVHESSVEPVVVVDDEPSTPSGPRRPADAARQSLRKVKGDGEESPAAPPDESRTKQTLGSMRGTATRGGTSAPVEKQSAEATVPDDPSTETPPDDATIGDATIVDASTTPMAAADPDTDSESAKIDRSTAEAAWEESLLDSLPGNVKARFSAAVFVDAPPGELYLALPNEIHRQRCEDVRQPVDDAFAQRFGQSVPLTLITEGDASAVDSVVDRAPKPPPSPEPSPPDQPARGHHRPPTPEVPPSAASAAYDSTRNHPTSEPDPDESIDLSSLTDANDVANSVFERISETFPGTEILNPEDDGL